MPIPARLVCLIFALLVAFPAFTDPLPSWNDSANKAAIIGFVESVTDADASTYVPEPDRIAVFDNDGTLWSEQPVYFQLLYALDVLRQKAADDPSVITSDVLQAAVDGDMAGMLANGEAGLLEIVMVSHANLSVDEFQTSAGEWVRTAIHPQTGMHYIDMTFQPMLELLRYLRDEGFATYIVSGGGIHFMRPFAEEAYGIPSEQVIGSTGNTRYEVIDGVPTLMKDPGIAFIDDKAGKPVGIDSKIGKRPILVGGNSDGDFQMLEWTTSGEGPHLGLIVHHTDAEREFAYDREGHIGVLNRGMDEADQRGWLLIDMASDWSRIWSGE